jgi:hypothetical protein
MSVTKNVFGPKTKFLDYCIRSKVRLNVIQYSFVFNFTRTALCMSNALYCIPIPLG